MLLKSTKRWFFLSFFLQIILNSMQKYQPSVRITSCESDASQQISHSFQFPETSFIAVTAYQNSRVRTTAKTGLSKLFISSNGCCITLNVAIEDFHCRLFNTRLGIIITDLRTLHLSAANEHVYFGWVC